MTRAVMARVLTLAVIAGMGGALNGCCCRQRCAPCGGERSAPALRVTQIGEDGRGQIFLDSTVYRVPAARGAEFLGAIAPTGERPYRVLSAAEAAAAQERWSHAFGSSMIQAPKILMLPGTEASVYVGEQYKADPADLAFSDEAANWVGFKARSVATVSADLRSITLDFSCTVRDPLPEGAKIDRATLAALAASEVFIEARGVEMTSGETVLLAIPTGGASKDRLVVLVNASVLGAPNSGS